MLQEARNALRISSTAYDMDITGLIRAGYADLQQAGVNLPGTVDFTEENGVYTDISTLEDDLCIRAIITYVRFHFGTPDDYDRVKASYDEQKTQLMHATGYTNWGGDCG